jgi:CheY-like chemotaxis protein
MSRVLVVEDDMLVRVTVGRMVRALGHEVESADGVEAALAILERSAFDVVITDFRMPPSDGITLARRVRERWPQTDVVLMSGELDGVLRARAAAAGVIGSLVKPFRLEALRAMLSRAPHVLIVEDDEAVADALRDVVAADGCEVTIASNGAEALSLLRTGARLPDAILLDLMMPVMDGWEFLRARDEHLRNVPVIVVTAGRADDLPDGVPLLKKPLSRDGLLGALRGSTQARSR